MFDPDLLRRAFQAGALATELTVITVAATVAGWFVDGLLGTRPWLTLLFAALGLTAGIVVLLKGLRGLEDDAPPPPDPPR